MVCEVVSAEELFSKAREAVCMLAALPPESLRLTKRLLKKRYAAAIAESIAEETLIFSERLSSPEAKEAMSAFLEKRKPDFSRF
jgi:enoyl-CoA hydratase/carnithine racemase